MVKTIKQKKKYKTAKDIQVVNDQDKTQIKKKRAEDLNKDQIVMNVIEWKAYLNIIKNFVSKYEFSITTLKQKRNIVKKELERVFLTDPCCGIKEKGSLFDELEKDGTKNTIEIIIDLNNAKQSYREIMIEVKNCLSRDHFLVFLKEFNDEAQSFVQIIEDA